MEGLGILVFFLFVYFIAFAFSIAVYVINSLALHTLAKNRGIRNYALAWIPIGSSWLLGKLADDVNICRRNKKTNFAKIILGLNIATIAVVIFVYIGAFTLGFAMAFEEAYPETASTAAAFAVFAIMFYIAVIGIGIANTVFTYMALYRVFYGYDEKNATLFIILSLFISGVQPFLLFSIRNRKLLPPDPSTFIQNGYPVYPDMYTAPKSEEVTHE